MTVQIEEMAGPLASEDPGGGTWVRVCRWGAIGIAAWLVLLQLIIGAVVPPMAVPAIVFGGLAVFLRPGRRRLALATGVLAALATIANLPGTIDALQHPSSGVAFAGGLWVLLAAIVTTVAGVAAFRGSAVAPARPLLVGTAVVMAVGGVVASIATLSVDSSLALDGDVEVVAELNEFQPAAIEVPAGRTGVWLDNRDGIRHTITLDATGEELAVPGYSAQRADFDLAPGTYVLSCTVPGHESMRIDVTVTP